MLSHRRAVVTALTLSALLTLVLDVTTEIWVTYPMVAAFVATGLSIGITIEVIDGIVERRNRRQWVDLADHAYADITEAYKGIVAAAVTPSTGGRQLPGTGFWWTGHARAMDRVADEYLRPTGQNGSENPWTRVVALAGFVEYRPEYDHAPMAAAVRQARDVVVRWAPLVSSSSDLARCVSILSRLVTSAEPLAAPAPPDGFADVSDALPFDPMVRARIAIPDSYWALSVPDNLEIVTDPSEELGHLGFTGTLHTDRPWRAARGAAMAIDDAVEKSGDLASITGRFPLPYSEVGLSAAVSTGAVDLRPVVEDLHRWVAQLRDGPELYPDRAKRCGPRGTTIA